MSNSKISAIVFDLGNVLIPFDYNLIINGLNKLRDGLGKKFYDFYYANYEIHREFERGAISDKDFLRIMLELVEQRMTESEFCQLYSEIFTVNEEVVNLLPVLKKDYKLFLLSNTNVIHQKYGWQQYKFLENFDSLILSHEVGFVKPEEEIYREVEKKSGLTASEHIFIDDVSEYAEAAKKIGWDGIQFTGYHTLVEELKIRNII